MSVFVRALLICLMALTLPLQGLASPLSLACAMTHHAAAVDAGTAHTKHAAHPIADTQHDEARNAHAHHASPDQSGHHATADDNDTTSSHTSCNGSAHCSLCPAMLPQLIDATLPTLSAPTAHPSLRPAPPSSFSPEGLERPPRRILA